MDIFKDGVLLDVNVSFWSGAKILKAEDLGLKEENVAEAYKLGRKMLIPEIVIRKFRALEAQARHIVKVNSFPFPIGNARFIPRKKFSKTTEALTKIRKKYDTQVEELIENYGRYRDEMIPIYAQAAETAFLTQEDTQTLFNIDEREKFKREYIDQFLNRIQAYYPDAQSLKSKYSLEWDIYEIALPKMKKSKAEDIIEEEEKKAVALDEYRAQTQQKVGAFINEVVTTLRQDTVKICNKIATNIKEGKIVKGKTLNALRDFIENFSELNFVGDTIESELEKLKTNFLDKYKGEENIEDSQDELRKSLNSIINIAENMTDINSITGEYKRTIKW